MMKYKRAGFTLNDEGFFYEGEKWRDLKYDGLKRVFVSPCGEYIAKGSPVDKSPPHRHNSLLSGYIQNEFKAMEQARIEGFPVVPCLMAQLEDQLCGWFIEPRVELVWNQAQEEAHIKWWNENWADKSSIVFDICCIGNNWGLLDGNFVIYDCSLVLQLMPLGEMLHTSSYQKFASYGWKYFHA